MASEDRLKSLLDWETVFADEVGRKPVSVEELYEWLDGLIERLANALFCNVEEAQGASLAVMNSRTLRRYASWMAALEAASRGRWRQSFYNRSIAKAAGKGTPPVPPLETTP
jgi:hypothetical protein